VSVAGPYRATNISVGRMAAPDVDVEVQQTGCDVSVTIPNYGSLQCTAQAPGALPRLASCTVHVDSCRLLQGYPTTLNDDGTVFSHSILGRFGLNCDGTSSGGTQIFGVTLTPR
jgi:hypothetical protein